MNNRISCCCKFHKFTSATDILVLIVIKSPGFIDSLSTHSSRVCIFACILAPIQSADTPKDNGILQSVELLLNVTDLPIVSSIIGTTFAWFTDSVESGKNKIVAGNLDVELEYYKNGEWQTVNNTTDLFENDTLWEPGHTEVVYLKMSNQGTLALKYQLNILPTGEVSKLADVIDVYFIDPAAKVTDRAALEGAKKLGTLTDVLAGMETSTVGTLDANKEVTVTLALKMQESAGNEYQGLSIGTMFAVKLLATQLTAEEDSFGPDYDKEAWGEGFKVFNAQELQAAVNNGEPNVILADNIDITRQHCRV